MIPVALTEWTNKNPLTMPPLAGISFDAYPQVRLLAQRLADENRLFVSELHEGISIEATSFVGRVCLGELTITIRPKLPGLPLWQLLSYAYNLRDLTRYTGTSFATGVLGFQELLIAQLIMEIEVLIARGLHRRYAPRHANLSSPRGRIDFLTYIRQTDTQVATLPCVDFPRIQDYLLNQALHAGLHLAIRLTRDHTQRVSLHRLLQQFDNPITPIELTRTMMQRIRRESNRLTRAYDPALSLIGLLVEGKGIELGNTMSELPMEGFLFDMNRFFQTLLTRLLQNELPEDYEVIADSGIRDMMKYEVNPFVPKRQAPVIRPDFIIKHQHRTLAVLDAKYRNLWERELPREMLYQLAIYACSQGATRIATILYPTLHEEATEARIAINLFDGGGTAWVQLRPVKMLTLAKVLERGASPRQRKQYAMQLITGGEVAP